MTQQDLSPSALREVPAWQMSTGEAVYLLVVALGVVAPLLLVLVVSLVASDPVDRAQLIVVGCESLALGLVGTILVSILYVMGANESALLSAPGAGHEMGGSAA